jgi:hypothetical protein
MPAPKYAMPPARLGFALWRSDKHSKEAIPAIVTAYGDRSVNLTVWAEDNRGGIPKDGVRHISDPEIEQMSGYSAGVWDYADDTKELLQLRHVVASLVDAMGGLPSAAG